MNRRQRKKKHLGEFQEFAFSVEVGFRGAADKSEVAALFDAFIDTFIEGNGLVFGGGGDNEGFRGWVSAGAKYPSPSEQHRALVGAWLAQQGLVEGIVIGPLQDAWTEHGERGAQKA